MNLLKKHSFFCFDEISRDFIKLGKENGLDNYFKEDPHAFSRHLWEARKKQFEEALNLEEPVIFFDRGVHDVVAYLNYIENPISSWENELKNFKYDVVILIKPEEKIYVQDDDRMETFEEAVKVHEQIKNSYVKSGLKIIELPFTTPIKRLNLVLKHYKNE
ncbi:ATP-binding protein [Flavobacteriaceae bacterium]|uniref:AAA family ATPase n=1 Tax=Candidatus Arcticimaribacter forsetii TaxID=2820661 RepID=UPI0020775B46|nr:ATP-binding protein [Candidatus Arcticimaribacter forsetii]MDA8699291.1 ATP-binding protein [Flavobacteriaceae bacterium]MDB4621012.1 ATP-binding protein [Flavobacteriaceae bacterium]MDB4674961.1 ATP-binding protein [Flavobacteriaceae bacterium]MDB4716991.1 ATP-binding protein [Flavobacteriaceae bacterium]MDB4751413.1 ATP-binding protein [Flavobacteriaceae bacterium]